MKSIVKCVENWKGKGDYKGRYITYHPLLLVTVGETIPDDTFSDKLFAMIEFETPFGVLGYLFTEKPDIEKLISDVEAGNVIEIEKQKVFDSRGVFVFAGKTISSQNFDDKMRAAFSVANGSYLSDLNGKLYDVE